MARTGAREKDWHRPQSYSRVGQGKETHGMERMGFKRHWIQCPMDQPSRYQRSDSISFQSCHSEKYALTDQHCSRAKTLDGSLAYINESRATALQDCYLPMPLADSLSHESHRPDSEVCLQSTETYYA